LPAQSKRKAVSSPSGNSNRVRLSVVIPALNEAASIARAVDSAWQAGAAEVLVADGGSSDDTAGIAADGRATVIMTPRGRAIQQNFGARQAGGDVLLFLHADNWLAGDIAEQVRAALADRRRIHGAFRQQIDADGFLYRLLERANAARVNWLGLPYGDQAIFIRRDTFDAIGGFPEVPLLEDLILMQRLRRTAWPVLLQGPVYVSPRRWQRKGVIWQTLRNWRLLVEYSLGACPQRLARRYPRHDE
jgi:rSAM/selenodomain-associated transferase 2